LQDQLGGSVLDWILSPGELPIQTQASAGFFQEYMDSSGPSGGSEFGPRFRLTDLIGVMIALATLVLPLMVITRYSPSQQLLKSGVEASAVLQVVYPS
jgi:hypothetical protein